MTRKPVPTSIAADAADTARGADNVLTEELKNSLDKIDLLVADLGKLGEFTRKAEAFVQEATDEIKWNKISRIASVAATLIIIITLLFFLRWALTGHYAVFAGNPNALSVLVGAIVGGVVILTIALTRAVHLTFAERNAGMPMPEHLKSVVDAVKSVLPGH